MVCSGPLLSRLRAYVMKPQQVRGVGLMHGRHIGPEKAHMVEVFRERARTETQVVLGNTFML